MGSTVSRPIENLQQHLKRKIGEYPTPFGGILELRERGEKEWEAIPQSVCRDLVESMPKRVAAVIMAKRGYTKYWQSNVIGEKCVSNKTVSMLSLQCGEHISANTDCDHVMCTSTER